MLYDVEGEDGMQDVSDDEEALKVSYASIMGRLKVSVPFHVKQYALR